MERVEEILNIQTGCEGFDLKQNIKSI